MVKKSQPYSATNLRTGVRAPTRICPVCGTNLPERALLLCYHDWALVPQYLKSEAMKAATENRDSLIVGEMAARVIASIPKELDEAA